MSSIMTVGLNLFLSCQDVGNLDGYFPVFTCFSLKGSTRILAISSEKHVIPHITQKEEEISSKPSKCFSWSLWIPQTKVFLTAWACCFVFCPIEFKNHIKQINNCLLYWFDNKFLTFCNNHSSFTKSKYLSAWLFLRSRHKSGTTVECFILYCNIQTSLLIPAWRKLEQKVCFLRICRDWRMWSKHKELMNSAVPENAHI